MIMVIKIIRIYFIGRVCALAGRFRPVWGARNLWVAVCRYRAATSRAEKI